MEDMMKKMQETSQDVDSSDIQAKLEVLKELHEMATALLGGELDVMPEDAEEVPEDMEQVTIAAEDSEGLEEGLDMAQDMLGKKEKSDKTGDFY